MGQISTFYPNPGPSQAEKFCKEEIRMRNLKRALSLTLASVMLLGMMVVGTSAAAGYSDVDENDNVEAIEVLQTIEVMVGDDRGFGPDRPVTRNEMAVVMGKLLNLDYNYYASACPFTDVAEWAKGWVGACAANGIVSGRGDGIYDGEATVTAVEAASMMMRALGYFQYTEDYDDGFVLATVRQGSDIGIFNGVGSDGNTPMTRNQVAQMALNALRSNMVIFTGTPGIDVNGVKINYRAEYTPRTGTDAKYDSIEGLVTTIGGDNSQFYIQLGEQLYDGDLRLEGSKDVFGRPARYWEYDGQEIGTYAKKELLRKEYTTKVTGRDLYDQLGSTLINGRGWTLDVAIDGNDTDNTLLFDETAITRTNKDGVGGTEKGVLTQVYVDNTAKRAYVVIINTYLAIASEDYDSKNGEVDLDVYHLDNTGTTKNPEYIKADVNGISVTVEDEDIDVSDVVDGDMFLVTVADGKIQSMAAPEVLADSEISSFKRDSDVVSEGKTYEYADTAKYDVEVLEEYAQTNLKDTTYNIILDQYGYLIGLEQNEEADQYVFLTGMNGNTSDLATKNADANVIFLDGSMKTVTVNVDKSKFLAGTESGPQMNTWCTYSVDSKDVYTLKEVATTEPRDGWKVAQKAQNVENTDEVKIDKKNVSLKAVSGNAYGNDDTVYLNVETKAIKAATPVTANTTNYWHMIINDVDSRVVGARNASLTVTNQTAANGDNGSTKEKAKTITEEIYTLYKENGYIIAAVTVEAEDDGLNKVFAYIHSDDVKRESYDKANDEWTWVREAIVDGKITDLKEVGGGTDLSVLEEDLDQGSWYELKLDADGNVTSATEQTFAAFNDSTNPDRIDNVDDVDDAVNAKDTVIMQVSGMVEGTNKLTYKNGTLYTEKDDTEGFSVSPDVKTVLCLSDGEGNLYDDCDDRYTGRKGLEDAIKNLDSNFTGELNVVFDKGDAVVIILVDGTGSSGGNGPSGDSDMSKKVVAFLNDDETQVTFVSAGGSATTNEKIAAVKAKAAEVFGVPESEITVKRATGKTWTITTESGDSAEWAEQTDVEQAGIPNDKNVWDQIAEEMEGESDEDTLRKLGELKALAESGVMSSDAVVTPTSTTAATITGIDWRRGLDVQVDGYGKAFDQTLLEMYGTQDPEGQDADARAKVSAATHWAVVPVTSGDNTTIYLYIYSGGKVYTVSRTEAGVVSVGDKSTGHTISSIAYTITPPKA